MSVAQKEKKRKPKVSKRLTLARRRAADRARWERRRAQAERQARERRHFRFWLKVGRYYRRLPERLSEREAIEKTLERYRPTESGHFPGSASRLRRWHRAVEAEGWEALRVKSSRPQTIPSQGPGSGVGLIFMLRVVLGWGGHRIAKELKARGVAVVSGATVYQSFDRLGLPV